MKQTLLLPLILSFFLACFSSCLKKGEDDPLISLRTRKNRLVGKWEVKNGNAYYKSGSWSTVEETVIYTSNSYQKTTEGKGSGSPISPPGITNGTFSYTLEFKKDGSFSSIQTTDNNISTLKGTWNFTTGVGKQKSKEKIVITIDSWINQPSMLSYAYTGNKTNFTYSLKELRNKKIVLVTDFSEIRNDGYETIAKSEFTFVQ